jgi:hypothetical protein
MPRCARCGKKAGGFSLRSFNDTTGLCDECDSEREQETRSALDGMRSEFLQIVDAGRLTKGNWISLEKRANQAGLDFNEALAYLGADLMACVKRALETSGEAGRNTEDEQSQFEYVVGLFAIPEYYHQALNQYLPRFKTVAILCSRCGAGIVGQSGAVDYTCSGCGLKAVLARCPSCSNAVHIHQELWGRSVRCMGCGIAKGWGSWNASRLTLGDIAKTSKLDQKLMADPSRRIVSGVVLGGSGYPIEVRVGCRLEFASDKVFIHYLFPGNQYQPVAAADYSEVISLQLGGRGSVTTGGGWAGGGFGLTGIITGAVLAGALNQMTARSTIETIIHFQTTVGELILFNNQYTPEQLRIMLSPALSRIEAAHRKANTSAPSTIDQLRELGALRESGTITEDEFQSLKISLLKGS